MSLVEELQKKYQQLEECQILETIREFGIDPNSQEDYNQEETELIFDHFRKKHGEPEEVEQTEELELSFESDNQSERVGDNQSEKTENNLTGELEIMTTATSEFLTEQSPKIAAQLLEAQMTEVAEIFAQQVNQKMAGKGERMVQVFKQQLPGVLTNVKKHVSQMTITSRNPRLIQPVDIEAEKLITPSSQENLPPS